MIRSVLIVATLAAVAVPAHAQQALPDLGTGYAVPASPLERRIQGDITAQEKGKYPPLWRDALRPLGLIGRAFDKPEATEGQAEPTVVVEAWHPHKIIRLRLRDSMATTVILPDWERIQDFYLGDAALFEAGKVRPNMLAILPKRAGIDTNLTLIGASGRVYSLYLRAEGFNSKELPDLTVFIHAEPEEPQRDEAAAETADEAAIFPAIPLDRDQWRCGDDSGFEIYARSLADAEAIAPSRVCTDGVWIFLDYAGREHTARRPSVFEVVEGVENPANTQLLGDNDEVIAVHSPGPRLALRNGDAVVCILPRDGGA